ncbi:6-phosphofructokinase [Butyrivibrio proteoclasticus]|uniref:6-phosphofructokinase n=1 Tax=Butyrivibrio proteoclasticus TaxID=43305 RepID=UPI00047C7C3D|nr:6-phosphofructokinase [Butyrivibrio proteoclasticus]
MNKKNVLVAQSGGPTSAINASLAGVLKATIDSDNYDRCYGAINGVLGVLSENYLDLTDKAKGDSDFIKLLNQTPAMYLGSCRFKLPEYRDDDSSYSFIFSQFRKLNIGAFFYIGGNDSMDTVLKLSNYAREIGSDVKIIGVPKTIDNDLCNTDHTPGFGSAAKYIASSLLEIAHDTFIYAVKSVTIVEIMGRDAGWLTAASALARNGYSTAPHLIYLPEVPFDKEKFISDVRHELSKRNNVIIAVSEGIRDKDGNYITSSKAMADTFGHQQLSGAGKALEFLVKENIDVKVRSVEINVLQRCAAHLASKTDLDESFAQGKKAVALSEEGQTGCMVVLKRISNAPYQVEYSYAQIKDIANEAKSVPVEWINREENDITEEFIEYLRPLIIGEAEHYYENGIPKYLDISHLNQKH